MKEFSFTEVIARIKEGQTYKVTNEVYNIQLIKRDSSSIKVIHENGYAVNIMDNCKFTLMQEPVPFMEAIKAFSKGTNIRCELNNSNFYYRDGVLKEVNGFTVGTCEILQGKWYLEEE